MIKELIMAKKIVTLYVDDTSLRLMVVQGKRIRKWADLPLEPELVKSNVVLDEAKVAAKVKQLFKTQKLRTKKVIVGLSGMHCLTRPMTLPALPKAMLDEAVMREAKRVLPVPLEQLYVSYQALPASEGKMQVFMVAIPNKTADSLLRMLHLAGLKPYLMDVKPLALARLATEATSILVDVQPAEFDIVIKAYGVPQPIRTVPLPSGELPWKEKWLKVKEDLDRTIKFYNSNNPEKPIGPDVPILVSGELANRPKLIQSLSDEFGAPVLSLSAPNCPEQLDSARYMVNIGLALKESVAEGTEASIANVNALPAPYRPKPVPLAKLVAVPSAIAFIGLTIGLTMVVQDASARVSETRGKLESTNNLIAQRQLKKKDLNDSIAQLQKKLGSTEASRALFTAALASLDNSHERINGDLQEANNRVPVTTALLTINQGLDRMTIQGKSPDEVDVLSYARSLEQSGRFAEVTISSITKNEAGMNFVLTLKAKGKK